jgi:hypothetical protein
LRDGQLFHARNDAAIRRSILGSGRRSQRRSQQQRCQGERSHERSTRIQGERGEHRIHVANNDGARVGTQLPVIRSELPFRTRKDAAQHDEIGNSNGLG